MGMFDTVKVEEEVHLPEWEREQFDAGWQTKNLRPAMDTYKITADGRLLKKEQSFRDKTDAEKQEEAEKWGFDSWEEYLAAYEENEEPLFPDEIDYEDDGEYPPVYPTEKTLDETWWADQNHHGSFEFHHSVRENPQSTEEMGEHEIPRDFETNEYWSFEARFTKGELDEVVLLEVKDYSDE